MRSAVQSTSDPTYVYSPYSRWVEVRGIIIEGKFVWVHVNVFFSFFLNSLSSFITVPTGGEL